MLSFLSTSYEQNLALNSNAQGNLGNTGNFMLILLADFNIATTYCLVLTFFHSNKTDTALQIRTGRNLFFHTSSSTSLPFVFFASFAGTIALAHHYFPNPFTNRDLKVPFPKNLCGHRIVQL